MSFIDGVRMVDLVNMKNEKKLEREIFIKKNPELLASVFDDLASETSSIASFNIRPNPHFHLKRNNSKTCRLSKENSSPLTQKHKKTALNLQALWANGGPIKLLQFPCDEAQGTLFFKNYEHLDPEGVKDLILSTGCSFLSLKEVEDDVIKVRLKTEDDTRKLYNFLKEKDRYDVIVLLDTNDYQISKKQEFRFKKLAKIRGHKYTSCRKIDEKDIHSKIDKMNELDAQIKFDIKPSHSLKCRSKENSRVVNMKCSSSSSYSDDGITRGQSLLLGRPGNNGSVDNVIPVKPQIGTWNGHIVIKPAIPAPILSKRPSLSEERGNSIRKPILQRVLDKNSDLRKFCYNSPLSEDVKSSHFDELSLISVTGSSNSDTSHEEWIYSDNEECNVPSEIQKPYKKITDLPREKYEHPSKSPSAEYSSFKSSETLHQSLRTGIHQIETREADEPKLISIFDIFMEVIKRNILDNVETSVVLVKE